MRRGAMARASHVLALALCLAQQGAAAAQDAAAPQPAGTPAPDAMAACFGAEAGGEAVVAAVDARGVITIADGRAVTLPGLRLLDGSAGSGTAAALLGRLLPQGTRLRLTDAAVGARPDRWGRLGLPLVATAAPDGSPDFLVAAALVEAGAALVVPEDLAPDCAAALMALERSARKAKSGAWADGGEGPWPAAEPGLARSLAGRYALFEGKIRSVAQKDDRIWLDFGRFGEDTLSVTIRKRTLNRLPLWGKRIGVLEGRQVRIRGVVLEGRQPVIEVTAAGQIEVLD
jgi:hypothetical protein